MDSGIKHMEVNQKSFIGGMNLIDPDTMLNSAQTRETNEDSGSGMDDQYRMCINGRARYGEVIPVETSTQQIGLPVGRNQGGITIGRTVIVFISGRAYYQLYGSNAWSQIPNFLMSAVAPRLWAIAIPSSNFNFVRKSVDSLNKPITINADVNISGNPAGILVQDNVTQAWLIEFNQTAQIFVARLTKTYAQWANTSTVPNDREYVPIGNQMFFLNQKLYIVAPDNKSIYQGVTGRPLDFMVNIDVNGNKLANESRGKADSVSFNFDSDEITCVKVVNTPDSFLYATARYIRVIQLDYNNTILGEPTYRTTIIVEAGIVNSESATYILGDYAFVDNDGIKSFNAVQSVYVEGRNAVFSRHLSKLFEGMEQVETSAISFNNYTLFYCRTTLGDAIVVYDELRKNWTSIDITRVTQIKQFLVMADGLISRLYAICENKVWLMYDGVTRESCQMWLPAMTPEDGKSEHKGQYVKPFFRGGLTSGTLRVVEYCDEQISQSLTRPLNSSVMAVTYPVRPPVVPSNIPNMQSPTVVLDTGLTGKKLAYVIIWNTDAALRSVQTMTSEQDADAAIRQEIN